MPTRLDKVAAGDVDAALLAYAGLRRLGLESRVAEIFDVARIVPAPGQGALAVQTRDGDDRLAALLRPLMDEKTWLETTAERALLGHLEGGCQVPVGAHATLRRRQARCTWSGWLRASTDGNRFATTSARRSATADDARARASLSASTLLDAGAREILAGIRLAPLSRDRARGGRPMKARALVANTGTSLRAGRWPSALRARGLESLHCPTVAIGRPRIRGSSATRSERWSAWTG